MDETILPRKFKPAEDSRLTFLLNMYYQLPGDNPTQYQIAADRLSVSKDEIFSRKQTITSDWSNLDLGWFSPSDILGIVIYNRTGLTRAISPTQEERENDASAVVEMSNPSGVIIPPKLFTTIWYKSFDFVNVRSLGAPASIQYMLVPK